MAELLPIPLVLRTRLAHATLQAVADECGADILHIKGAAVDASLRPARQGAASDATAEQRAMTRISADADVLVRPSHLRRFLAALEQHNWRRLLAFDTGGGADHSAVYWHDELCEADVHRSFPGMRLTPELAFERLWVDRRTQDIGHRSCTVPSTDAQRLVLLLHAARNRHGKDGDVQSAWTDATSGERDRVSSLARELDAEVALATATGRLGEYADRPDYDLWRLWTTADKNRFAFWLARIKAAQTVPERIRVVANPFQPKLDALAMQLGRRPRTYDTVRFRCGRLREDLVDVQSFLLRRIARRRSLEK